MATVVADPPAAELHHSKSMISFEGIVTKKLIDDLRNTIKEAQKAFCNTDELTSSANNDNPATAATAPAPVANVAAPAPGADVATPAPADGAPAPGAVVATPAPGANVAAPAPGADVSTPAPGVDKSNSYWCFSVPNGSENRNVNGNAKGKKIVAEASNGGGSINSQKLHLNGKLEKLGIDLNSIHDSFTNLRKFEEHVVTPFEIVSNSVENLVAQINNGGDIDTLLKDETFNKKLVELDKMLTNMKIHTPSSHKMYTAATNAQTKRLHAVTMNKLHGVSEANVLDELPILPSSDSFLQSPAFLDIKELYDNLSDFQSKLCLLCFSIFPENVIIKRRILLYWWIGEGLILLDEKTSGAAAHPMTSGAAAIPMTSGAAANPRTSGADADQMTAGAAADKILKELVEKGFIEPIDQKYRPVAKSFRMHPLIRSAVIVLSKQVGFFDFDDKGKPTTKFLTSRRACLVGVGTSYKLTKVPETNDKNPGKKEEKSNKNEIPGNKEEMNKIPGKTEETSNNKIPGKTEETSNNNIPGKTEETSNNNDQLDQQKLNTLYNVNEQYLRLEQDWFLKLTNVQVLQLGRWMNSAENHIEVEGVEFFKNLRYMKHLMYFSLQGISRISELPDTIGDLTNLRILDLRACHNLEKVSSNIGLLKYLTRLDMSECYLLDSVPKEIAKLSRLEVLKGFVVGDPLGGGNPCTIEDLKALVSLRKLSISTGSKDFPSDGEVRALHQFKALCNLKIIWGGNSLEKAIEAEGISHNDSKNDGPGATPGKKKFGHSKTILEAEGISLNDPKKDGPGATPGKKEFVRSKTIFEALATFRRGTHVFEPTALPDNLEKLDLQCFPHTKRPSWLKPRRLEKVRKLYIRGGRLSDLCDQNDPWGDVEILCLKHVYELSMDWTEMHSSFPKLKHLEFVQCPKLAFFPSDDKGVWTKPPSGAIEL